MTLWTTKFEKKDIIYIYIFIYFKLVITMSFSYDEYIYIYISKYDCMGYRFDDIALWEYHDINVIKLVSHTVILREPEMC